jgi:DNA-binding LacI/PurR family transcriptional regulator
MYPKKVYAYMKQLKIPVALIDTYDEVEFFHNICIDDEEGGYLATKYLIGHGHEKIGILGGDIRVLGVMQRRFEGYKRALKEAGISYREEWTFEVDITCEGGYGSIRDVLSARGDMTAIFAVADIIAIGLLKGLREHRISVPKDLSIIGFDDLEACEHIYPPLTTVKQDIFKKGKKAVEKVIEEINQGYMNHKVKTILPIEIIERESVQNIKNKKIKKQ